MVFSCQVSLCVFSLRDARQHFSRDVLLLRSALTAIGPPAREWFRMGYRRFTCHFCTLEDFLVPHVFGFRILFFSSNGSLYHTLAFNAAFADSTLGGACGLSCGGLRQLCPPTCWLQLCARVSACGGPHGLPGTRDSRRTGDTDPCRFASCESSCFSLLSPNPGSVLSMCLRL